MTVILSGITGRRRHHHHHLTRLGLPACSVVVLEWTTLSDTLIWMLVFAVLVRDPDLGGLQVQCRWCVDGRW